MCVDDAAGAPTGLESPSAARRAVVDDLQGEARTIGRVVPVIAVVEVEDRLLDGALQLQVIAVIGKVVVGEDSEDGGGGSVAGLEGREVLDRDAVGTGGERDVVQVQIHAAAEAVAVHVERGGADVAELDVFKLVRVVGIPGERIGMIIDFGDAQRWDGVREVVGAHRRRGPRADDLWAPAEAA